MPHSRHKFNEIAKPEAKKSDYPPPFSLRLTYEERARLDAERGSKTLAAYIRSKPYCGGILSGWQKPRVSSHIPPHYGTAHRARRSRSAFPFTRTIGVDVLII